MRIVIEGPPQCGKTTIATVVKERYGLCYISASEAVRSAVHAGDSNAHSATLRRLIDGNERIPDALLVRVVADATRRPDCVNGFVLDAFPATRRQARLLLQPPQQQQSASAHGDDTDTAVHIDAVVELDVAEYALQQRFAGRWLHAGSGRMYHTLYDPPAVAGVDNVTGEPLVQRDEDTHAAIAQRVASYRKQAADLRSGGVFRADQWLVADANGDVDDVRRHVFDVVDALRTHLRAEASATTTSPPQPQQQQQQQRRWWQWWA